jgi:hypothetical protein
MKAADRMSAWGQRATCVPIRAWSALPLKATGATKIDTSARRHAQALQKLSLYQQQAALLIAVESICSREQSLSLD